MPPSCGVMWIPRLSLVQGMRERERDRQGPGGWLIQPGFEGTKQWGRLEASSAPSALSRTRTGAAAGGLWVREVSGHDTEDPRDLFILCVLASTRSLLERQNPCIPPCPRPAGQKLHVKDPQESCTSTAVRAAWVGIT